MKSAAALSAFIVITLALVAVAVVGAQRISTLHGVSAVHSTAEHVFVAVGDQVVIATHDGAIAGVAEDEAGVPWAFEAVSGFAVDGDGNLFVADGDRGEVVRFDREGRGGTRLPLRGERSNNFELAVFADGRIAVADTRHHRVSVVAPTGEVIATQRVTYPNGLSIGPGEDGAEALYVLETGSFRLHAFDSSLKRVETPLLESLRAVSTSVKSGTIESPRLAREMLDFALGAGGSALVHYCRNTEGDCTVVAVDPAQRHAIPRADISMLDAELTDWAASIMMTTESATGPGGRVYVASPMFASLLVFDPPGGDAPLCTDCRQSGVQLPQISFDELWSGPVSLPNGASVSLFGEDALLERYRAQWRARTLHERVEKAGRYGVIASALLLLGLLFILRQSGAIDAAQVQSRIAEVVDRIVRPDAGALVGAAMLLVAAGGFGAGLGYVIVGSSGAVPLGIAAAFLTSRIVATPLLLRWRQTGFAVEAWKLHHGPERLPPLALSAGESIEGVAVASRSERTSSEVQKADAASEAGDPLEVLEAIAPRATLLVRTNQRLILSPISVFGAPVDAIVSVEVDHIATERPGVTLVTASEAVTYGGPQLTHRREELVARSIRYLCERCGANTGTCAHTGASRAPLAVLLSGLCPGLGHLLQYRFRRARSVMAVGLTFLFAGLYELLPQLLGTVPYAPSRFMAPLLAYGLVWSGSLVDVVAWSIRQRRRTALNEAAEASNPDYADLGIG